MTIKQFLGLMGRAGSSRTQRSKREIFELQPLERRVLMSTTTLNPIADAYVQDGTTNQNTNFGTNVELQAKSNGTGANRHTYLRFSLAGVAAVDSAMLRLYGRNSDATPENVTVHAYQARNNTWTESAITWNQMAAVAMNTASLDNETLPNNVASWYTFNVTSLVAAQKAAGATSVSIEVRSPAFSTSVPKFNSREAATNRPELVVVASAPAAPSGLAAGVAPAAPSTVNVSWTDNSNNEASFLLDRSASPTFASGTVTTTPVAANATGATIANLAAGTYYFRVRATNAIGSSANSNVMPVVVRGTPALAPTTGFEHAVIGNPDSAGSAVYDPALEGGTHTLRVSGADIWGTADQFRLAYYPMTGDGTIEARVTFISYTHPYAKGGVMVREGLSAGARNAFVAVHYSAGVGFQSRAGATGGSSTSHTLTPGLASPYWVRLTRAGDLLAASRSADGQTWTPMGTTTLPSLAGTVYVGLAATSHDDSKTGTVRFNGISIIGDVAAPDAPGGLTATVESPSRVDLAWTDNADDETAYRVYRRAAGATTWTLLSDAVAANATTYADTTVQAGQSYEYIVRAARGTAESLPSNVAQVTVAAVAEPFIVDNADATGVTVTGTWVTTAFRAGFYKSNYLHDDNLDKGNKSIRFTPSLGGAAGTYAVYAQWTDGTNRATNVPIDVVHAGGTSTVTVNQQANGGSWRLLGTYAFNATGGSVLVRTAGTNGFVIADAVRFVRVDAAALYPAAPNGLTATAVAVNQVNLTWTERATNEQAYQLYRRVAGATTWGQVGTDLPADSASYTDRSVQADVSYEYQVRAVAPAGPSSPSNTATVAVPATGVPASPTGLWLGTSPATPTSITVNWTDNSTNETGFVVQRRVFNPATNTFTWQTVATAPTNATSVTLSNLTTGESAQVRVAAENAQGRSPYSGSSSATVGGGSGGGGGSDGGPEPDGGSGRASNDGVGWYAFQSISSRSVASDSGIQNVDDHLHARTEDYVRANSPEDAVRQLMEGHVVVTPPPNTPAPPEAPWHGGQPATLAFDGGAFEVGDLSYTAAGKIFKGLLTMEDLHGSVGNDGDQNDVTWEVAVKRLDIDTLDLTVADPANGGNTVENGSDFFIEVPGDDGFATVDLSAVFTPFDTYSDQEAKHVHWKFDTSGNHVSPSNEGTFENPSHALTIAASYGRQVTVHAGLDANADGELNENERSRSTTIHLVTVTAVTVRDTEFVNDSSINFSATPKDMFIGVRQAAADGSVAAIEIDAETLVPDLSHAGRGRIAYRVTGDVTIPNGATGTLVDASTVKLAPTSLHTWQNRTFVVEVGFDSNKNGELDAGEADRTINVKLIDPALISVRQVQDAVEGGSVEFVVTRHTNPSFPIFVTVEGSGGTAIPGTDYVAAQAERREILFSTIGGTWEFAIDTIQNDKVEISRTVEFRILRTSSLYEAILPTTDSRTQRHKPGVARAYIDDDDTGPFKPIASYATPRPMNALAQDVADAEANPVAQVVNCEVWAFNVAGNGIRMDAAIATAVNSGIFWSDATYEDIFVDAPTLKRVFESMLYSNGSAVHGFRTTGTDPVPNGWHRITAHWVAGFDYHFTTEDLDPATGVWSWSNKEGFLFPATNIDNPEDEMGTFLGYYFIDTPPRHAAATP